MDKSIHSSDQKALQNLLIKVRQESGLLQVELASKLNKPQSFVSKYESGERRLDLIELRQICKALGISLPDLVSQLEALLE